MAIKKEMKSWAIKIRGRSFFLRTNGTPWTFGNKQDADHFAQNYVDRYKVPAKPVRVKFLVEEI